jgi:hypothetical protein
MEMSEYQKFNVVITDSRNIGCYILAMLSNLEAKLTNSQTAESTVKSLGAQQY